MFNQSSESWHRNIPEAADPAETWEQEIERVRPHIPAHLLDIWTGLVHDKAAGPGWPEFMAQMLALKPHDVMAVMSALAIIHCQRLGGSLLKVESSGAIVCCAVLDAKPLLAHIYRMARMTAVMSSSNLRSHERMHPLVNLVRTLVERSDQASHDLADAAMKDQIVDDKLAKQSVELAEASRAVKALLDGQPGGIQFPTVAGAPSTEQPPTKSHPFKIVEPGEFAPRPSPANIEKETEEWKRQQGDKGQ
jgi:hypothetical protein